MDKINWRAVSGRLKRTFKCLLTCDIQRTMKTLDEIGGDVEYKELVYRNVECYASQHPWYGSDITSNQYAVEKRGNWRIHFHPEIDVRDGDILILHGRPERQFLVTRTACYPSHTRVEVSIWDPMS